ncbi:MAG: metal-dependent hydrolase, partial [Nanoarchaeota archaeon]|nr:metal-dependent hydrolase [Nanoarchaeota archaeon]
IDIEWGIIAINYMFKKKKNIFHIPRMQPGILHSIVGAFSIGLPLTVYVSSIVNPGLGIVFDLKKVLLSSIIGLISHLLIDIPAHQNLMMFWPIKVFEKNPFLLFKKYTKLYEKYNIYKKIETFPQEFLPTFNYLVFSHVFLVISLLIFFVFI